MINEPDTPEQRQVTSLMRNIEAMPADEQRKIRGRIYGFLRNLADLDLDDQPPAMRDLIVEARHLLRPPD
jgi:hypothetical protein